MFHSKKILSKNIALLAIIGAVFFSLFSFSQPVLAESVADPNSSLNQGVAVIEQPLGLPAFDIRIIIARIIRIALGLIGIVMVCLMLYGGYLWMTAGGNEEKISDAKKVITNAAIGLAIILSAYAIVAFVMRMLGLEGGQVGGEGTGVIPVQQNFIGSGALGRIIKDHYPYRDQVDVPRNTKIVITFRRPIRPESIIDNTNAKKDNKNTIYGDCINIGQNMDWKTDCDTLKSGANLITITRADNNSAVQATALATYDSQGKVYTVVMRPYDLLGNADSKVLYKVHVGDGILLDDALNNNPSIFAGASVGNNYYDWQFTCDTKADTTPPHIQSVFPDRNAIEAKNSVIQIDFNKAIDPIGIQGPFTSSPDGYYVVKGNNVFLQTSSSSIPLGDFDLINGYHTLEFTPTVECGKNACGGTIYCLPVCDKPGESCDSDVYHMIIKAGQVFTKNSFEAVPFSGVMDLSGNALDSSQPYGDAPRIATTSLPVFNNWKQHDNDFWDFTVENKLDASAPYLQKVAPGIDGTFIGAYDEWKMQFSKRMRIESMYTGIQLEEKNTNPNALNIPLWYAPRVGFLPGGKTLTLMNHGPFDQDQRHYYYPSIDSSVEDVHFNCLYPGQGPTGFDQNTKESQTCDPAHFADPNFCCQVTSTPQSAAYCCNGISDPGATTTQGCWASLKSTSL